MKKYVEKNTSERYVDSDAKVKVDRRKELFDAVHKQNSSWNQYRQLL